jgi:endothelin-converting enzyme
VTQQTAGDSEGVEAIEVYVGHGKIPSFFPFQTQVDLMLLSKAQQTYQACMKAQSHLSLYGPAVTAILGAFDQGLKEGGLAAITKGMVASMLHGGTPFLTLSARANGRTDHASGWGIFPAAVFPNDISQPGEQIKLLEALEFIKQLDRTQNPPLSPMHMQLWDNNPTSEVARAVINFVEQLKSNLTPMKLHHFEAFPMTFSALEHGIPSFPWRRLISELMFQVKRIHCDGVHWSSCVPGGVVLRDLTYLKQLGGILQNTHFLIVRLTLALSSMYQLSEVIRFVTGGHLPTNHPMRSAICHQQVRQVLPLAFMRWLGQNKVSRKDRDTMNTVFSDLIAAAKDRLTHRPEWMDELTRQSAIEKLGTMALEVGFPEVVRQGAQLYFLHNAYKPDENDWIATTTANLRWTLWKEILIIQQPKYRAFSLFTSSLIESQAAYCSEWNLIIVSNRLMRQGYPRYQRGMPNSILYGTVGFILGHEISHGLFYPGRDFQGTGRAQSWWTTNTKANFDSKIRKLIQEEFSSFAYVTAPGKTTQINGKTTLPETTADLGGFQLAWDAFLKREEVAPSSALPNFSPRLKPSYYLFLAMAQTFCVRLSDQWIEEYFKVQPMLYPPDDARVNAVVRQSQEFADLFQCPLDGSKDMCPTRRFQLL